jgi:hypothetical protein
MTWVAVAIGGSAALGALSSRSAAKRQERSAREGMAMQERMFNKQNELQEPFRQAGITGQNRYMELLGLGGNTNALGYGKYSRDFGMSDFEKDPGYDFRLTEGLKALDRQAAARGGMISGKALKAAGRYGQDYASNEYGNAFNRYQINRSNQLNPLAALAGMGQGATNVLSSAAGQFGDRFSAGAADIGNAQAAGRMGMANAISGGVGQGMNFYQNNRLMNLVASRGGTTNYPGYGETYPGAGSLMPAQPNSNIG